MNSTYFYEALAGIKNAFKYKKGIVFSFIFMIVRAILTYYLWKAIYSNNEKIVGQNFMFTYIINIISICLVSIYSTNVEYDLYQSMMLGHIFHKLLKPVNLFMYLFSGKLGAQLIHIIFMFFFVICSVIFFDYNINCMNLFFFSLSFIISFLVIFYIDILLGIISYYTQSIWGLISLKNALFTILSGSIIPIFFFPDWLIRFSEKLPYTVAVYNTALLLVQTKLDMFFVLKHFAVLLLWVISLSLLTNLIFKFVRVRISQNGG